MFLIYSDSARAEVIANFRDVIIEPAFQDTLYNNPDFMERGGVQIFNGEDNQWALISIAKLTPQKDQLENISEITRIGEIKARTNVLKFFDGLTISNSRENYSFKKENGISNETTSLKSFFQATKVEAKGQINQLPVIGTWWAKDRNIFYVAVGTSKSKSSMIEEIDDNTPVVLDDQNFPEMRGDPFFIALIQTSPVLIKNGGIRCFEINDGRKALVSVASAKITGSRVDAKKIARFKAIRALIGQKNGVDISSIETLTDQEVLLISNKKTKRVLLSEFFSIQEEQVEGFIQALPVVAEWEDKNSNIFISLGK